MLSIFSCTYWPFEYFLWRNVYSDPLSIFKLGYMPFLILSCKSSLYILDKSPLSNIWFINNFSHSTGFLLVSFAGFPGGSGRKESACNVGDLGSIPGSGRSPAEGNGNPFQYSCLEDSMDRGAYRATVHGNCKGLDMTE